MNEIDSSSYIALTTKHSMVLNYIICFNKQKGEPNLSDIAPSLKQELLLFDKVGIAGLGQFMQETSVPIEKINNELNWLISQGLLFDAKPYIPYKGTEEESSFNDFLKQLGLDLDVWDELENYQKLNYVAIQPLAKLHSKVSKDFFDIETEKKLSIEEYNRARLGGNQENSAKHLSEYAHLLVKKLQYQKELNKQLSNNFWNEQKRNVLQPDSLYVRMVALTMIYHHGISPLSLLPYKDYTINLPYSKKSQIMQVVIKNFPLLDNSTPWEQIVDFRNNPKSRQNLLAFRKWIRKLSSENLMPQEIQEELEYLINEFNNHMKINKMKSNIETIETLIKLPLELLENALKLNFSKLLEPLFAVNKRHVTLLEAEINSPGREIAYLIKARELFE